MIIIIFIFGLLIGSFINCLVWRLHQEETILGRSYCPRCKAKIAWYDNVPLLSFLILRGKCRHCHKKISWQYPLIELATGLLFALSYWLNIGMTISNFQFPISDQIPYQTWIFIIRDIIAISFLIIIFIYDLKYYLILDKISIPAIILLFCFNIILGFNWQNILISGIIGGSFFLLQFVLSKGKWVGGGDIRLGVLMGVLLGWPHILTALFIAYILGSLVAIPLLALGKKKFGSKLPMGAFLVPATIIALYWGDWLVDWYFNLIVF